MKGNSIPQCGLDHLPRSRAEARAIRAKHYISGKPCKRNHLAPRFTGDGTCTECKKEALRRSYAANPEPAKERVRRWRERQRAAKHAPVALVLIFSSAASAHRWIATWTLLSLPDGSQPSLCSEPMNGSYAQQASEEKQ